MSIEEIIEKSFNDLIKAITTDGTSSQLLFPHSNFLKITCELCSF